MRKACENPPKPTVERLPIYRRALEILLDEGCEYTSSCELAELAGVTASRLRKDLSFFGRFGTAGMGYPVRELLDAVNSILGVDRLRDVLLVGMGNLGRAIANHGPLKKCGFRIAAAVDVSPAKVGRVICGVRCYPPSETARLVREGGIEFALLAVPPGAAREAAERLAEAGIKAILNFTPVHLRLPRSVVVEEVDFGILLQKVAFAVTQGGGEDA